MGVTHTRDRLIYLGRSWCYIIHRERMKKLGLFEIQVHLYHYCSPLVYLLSALQSVAIQAVDWQ